MPARRSPSRCPPLARGSRPSSSSRRPRGRRTAPDWRSVRVPRQDSCVTPSRDPLTFEVQGGPRVSARLELPAGARACYLLAHGAGAGMEHPFLSAAARELAALGIATLRYQFPYMQRRSRRPDPPPVCHATVRAAVATAVRLAPALPLFAGGRSFGGRMTSQAEALAERGLLEGIVGRLGARATLSVLEDADHSFHVPARSGRRDPEVRSAAWRALADWIGSLS